MAKDPDQITVGANGTVRVAPVGTTEPADISASYDAAWVDLGYTTEDGVTFKDAKTQEPIKVWQSFYPVRRIITERDFTAVFSLQQFAGAQVEFAFGGGEVTEDSPGKFRFTPPDPSVIDERAMAVDWTDGEKNYRLIMPRGMVTEAVETKVVRTTNQELPITFSVNGSEDTDPWYLLTDDPAYAEAT